MGEDPRSVRRQAGLIHGDRLTSPSRDLAERLDEVFGPDGGTFARLETGLRDLPYPASFRPL